MAANLESVVGLLILKFENYAGKDGDSSTLSQNELCDLAVKEFPSLCNNAKKDDILKGIFGSMDFDGDNKVNFKEYIVFIGCLAMALKDHMGGSKK